MTKNKNPSVTVVTEPFVLSYPKLLKAEPYVDPETQQPKGEPVYSFEALVPVDNLGAWQILENGSDEFVPGSVEKRLVRLAKEKWGDDYDVSGAVKHGGLSWPFKSGDKKVEAAEKRGEAEKVAHYRGKKIFRAKALAEIKGNPNEPTLYRTDVDGELVKINRGTEDGRRQISDLFYGGALCTAELNAVAGMAGDNKYVTFYVNCLIFEEDGERLGNGGGSAIEKLRGVKGGKTDYDPTKGMSTDLDDEIPF